MKFAALDVGTSFTKTAIIDVQALQIEFLSRVPAAEPQKTDDPLLHELDAEHVLDSARSCLAELIKKTPDCQGILITGQMGGLVLCRADGSAMRPYISWLDRRATAPHPHMDRSVFEVLTQAIGADGIQQLGNEFRPGLPLSFLFWLHVHGKLTDFRNAVPVTLPDYIAAALCRSTPVMEWTSTPGLLDVRRHELACDLFERIGLTGLQWPRLVSYRHVIGRMETPHGRLPVYAAVGDHQCSLAGTFLQLGELSINISTGSQVSLLADVPQEGNYQLRRFFDGLWLKTITHIPAGRSLSALLRLFTELSPTPIDLKQAYRELFQRAGEVPETDVDVNLGFFPGVIRGPGHIGQLHEGNLTVGHIGLACLKQMARYYREMADRVAPEHDFSEIVFSGGLARMSELLRTLVTEELNSPCRVAETTEDSLLGLALIGRVVSGLNPTLSDAVKEAQHRVKSGAD